MSPLVSENLMGNPGRLTSPRVGWSTLTNISLALACSLAFTWSRSRTGATGTPVLARSPTTSSTGLSATHFSTSSLVSSSTPRSSLNHSVMRPGGRLNMTYPSSALWRPETPILPDLAALLNVMPAISQKEKLCITAIMESIWATSMRCPFPVLCLYCSAARMPMRAVNPGMVSAIASTACRGGPSGLMPSCMTHM
ncbi:hypothetical protein ES703_19864 [subsurface metagenome]